MSDDAIRKEANRKRVQAMVEEEFGPDAAQGFEIIGSAPILWSGWEGDTDAVVVRLPDGNAVWMVVEGVHVGSTGVAEVLRERLDAYRKAIEDTEALLKIAEANGLTGGRQQ